MPMTNTPATSASWPAPCSSSHTVSSTAAERSTVSRKPGSASKMACQFLRTWSAPRKFRLGNMGWMLSKSGWRHAYTASASWRLQALTNLVTTDMASSRPALLRFISVMRTSSGGR
jgi:hypothetical protein